MFDKPVGGARRVVDDEYDGGESIAVEGWAKTTCLVFPLLWKSRLALVDTAIFDSESRYKQHLFTSICKQKMKSGNTYVEVKRRKKIHLTFDHLDERFTSRCYKRDTNLWATRAAPLLTMWYMRGSRESVTASQPQPPSCRASPDPAFRV